MLALRARCEIDQLRRDAELFGAVREKSRSATITICAASLAGQHHNRDRVDASGSPR